MRSFHNKKQGVSPSRSFAIAGLRGSYAAARAVIFSRTAPTSSQPIRSEIQIACAITAPSARLGEIPLEMVDLEIAQGRGVVVEESDPNCRRSQGRRPNERAAEKLAKRRSKWPAFRNPRPAHTRFTAMRGPSQAGGIEDRQQQDRARYGVLSPIPPMLPGTTTGGLDGGARALH